MEFLNNTDGTHETLQTHRWPSKLIILLMGHFEGPTVLQQNSW